MLFFFYWAALEHRAGNHELAVNLRLVAAWMFIAASITDWFDGYLARKWGQMTPFGAFLDPVADKLIVAAALIAIVQQEDFQIFRTLAVIVIISREITVSAVREWMAEIGERGKVAVGWVGKLKTTFQMLAIGFMLWKTDTFNWKASIGYDVMQIGELLLFIAAALTLWSMFIYLKAAWPSLKGKH